MAAKFTGDLRHLQHPSSSSSPEICLRLREALEACSSSMGTEDIIQSNEAVAPVTNLLHTLMESSTSDGDESLPGVEGLEVALNEIYHFIFSADSNQMVVEALSLELPKLVITFAPLSVKCGEIAGKIIECLVSICNPREMLSVLCEALTSHADASDALGCYSHFVFGLSKVLLRIQRRHVEQVKVALPVILGVLTLASSESDEEDTDSLNKLFSAAISIGSSIQEVCQKLEGERKELLCAILGLYVLQNIALISRARQRHIFESSSTVAKFSQFLPFCGLSYPGLLTGHFDKINEICKEESVVHDDDDEFIACFSSASAGASLAVIWGHISDEVEKAAGEQLDIVVTEVRQDRFMRLKAIGMFTHILISVEYPWIIKSHCLDVLLSMIDGIISEEQNDVDDDFSSFLPNLFTSLMAIKSIMMGAPDPSLRKKAFNAFRKVVSEIPCSQRFDTLKAIITNSDSPSMVAILIDMVKGEVLVDNHPENSENAQNRKEISKFWGSNALEIVEMVLRPHKGGPPSLPEHSEPVLSALNLYRFIMLIELTGKTNTTGVLCQDSLRKAYSEWLLPLRTLISGILAENQKEGTELSESITCALSPLQLVLYRCLELVEENLNHP
ncbi:aberrant root formation protein 4 isoform X2 [Phalaenopsis equestris]|uniref:aberrant root formation protein 4 isoform X2 n=1 Tax=Phalaenopsis equestris TaxID=78828 RepID=UPI0009E3B970|nr:aberrant root formation protein 4 isoform X2 [Phalaenopsis equestris]